MSYQTADRVELGPNAAGVTDVRRAGPGLGATARGLAALLLPLQRPGLSPYVVLNGLSTGMFTDEQRRRFQAAPPSAELTPSQFEIDKPPPLF